MSSSWIDRADIIVLLYGSHGNKTVSMDVNVGGDIELRLEHYDLANMILDLVKKDRLDSIKIECVLKDGVKVQNVQG